MNALGDFLRLSVDGRHADLLAEAEARRLTSRGSDDVLAERTLAVTDTVVRFERTTRPARAASAAECAGETCVEVGAAA